MLFLEDGEMAELTASGARIETLPVARRTLAQADRLEPVMAERGGYKHFMLKEIHEQPRSIEDTLRGRIDLNAAEVVSGEMGIDTQAARAIERVYLIACGTSHYATMAGRYWIEQLAPRSDGHRSSAARCATASPSSTPTDLVVAVSQSGETADTLAAVKAGAAPGEAKAPRALQRPSTARSPAVPMAPCIPTPVPKLASLRPSASPRRLAALLMLAVYLGRTRETLAEPRARAVLQGLVGVPGGMRTVLRAGAIASLAHCPALSHRARHAFFSAEVSAILSALEGALKLKEIAYIHAEGYGGRRNEARAICPHRRSDARGGRGRARRALRQDPLQRGRGSRARWTGHRAGHRRRPPDRTHRAAGGLDSRGRRGRDAAAHRPCRSSYSPITSPISKGPTSTSRATSPRRSPSNKRWASASPGNKPEAQRNKKDQNVASAATP